MKAKKDIDLQSLQWTVVKVNGKIASVTLGMGGLKRIVDYIVKNDVKGIESISSSLVSMNGLESMSASLTLDDLIFFGTDFQKEIWSKLFLLSHSGQPARIMSYSEFAGFCSNPKGLRAIAHALGLNPIAFILPCHRIIPKECIRNIEEAYQEAIDTIFKGQDLYVYNAFDFGEYALGKQMKRELIALELSGKEQ